MANTLNTEQQLERLAERIGYSFKNPELLRLAMSHRSWCAERRDTPSNERLELLGDAVLGHCVTAHLYRAHPRWSEGDLAQARSAVVNASSLAAVARTYAIGDALLLGIGEDRSGGRDKASLLCDAFEALLGALYLDAGLDVVEDFILGALRPRMDEVAANPGVDDPKTRLQEFVVRIYGDAPVYTLTESGPDHDKSFCAEVSFGGVVQGSGKGSSKKQAEQSAAGRAWHAINSAQDIDHTISERKPEQC